MAVPKYYECYNLVLTYLYEQNKPFTRKEIVNIAIEHFNPTKEELEEKILSGTPRFIGNVGWAIDYLKQAGLIENTSRGVFQITESGIEFITANPQFNRIDIEKLPAIKEWRQKKSTKKNKDSLSEGEETQEETSNQNIRVETEEYYRSVELDILQRLKELGTNTSEKGTQFENICLDLLVKMGYGKKENTGGSGDRGIDGFLTTDVLGFEKIGVQCKCYTDGNINDSEITKFAHGLKHVHGLNKGIFITTTDYTPSAKKVEKESKDIKIILIEGIELAQLMRKHEVGVQIKDTNYIYDITIGEDQSSIS